MNEAGAQRARRRAARARRRRRRRLIPLAAAVVAIAALWAFNRSGPGGDTLRPKPAAARTRLVATLQSPSLPAPISGESAVGEGGGPLILGGLDAEAVSASGVFMLDAGSGQLRQVGNLSAPLHDAAAVTLGDHVLVFGGGTSTSSDEVQALPVAPGAAASDPTAQVVGHLPTVRSDLSAVAIGGSAYVLGGYDGTALVDSVLETSDGSSFNQVATLPVPGRYMAAAALGGRIYAFGGQTVAGEATNAIQEVDPRGGSAHLIGRLPVAISRATAVAIAGRIYLLGGEAGGSVTDRIWSFDPSTRRVTPAGQLPQPVANAAGAVVGPAAYLIGGTGPSGTTLDSVVVLRLRRVADSPPAAKTHPRSKASPRTSSVPFSGHLMIADRGNNRLIVVDAHKHISWLFPSRAHPAPPGGFYFPDDAFFIRHGTGIISNEEQNERIVQLSYPSGKLTWSYGHPGIAGSEPGYLHEPDDAYLWRDGTISVADAQNCRVLLIDSHTKKVTKQFGDPASCAHEPPAYLGSPNGDTPLRNGDILISEVNGSYIDEITRSGKVVWSVQLPIAYPSDPQQLGPDRYLVADYTSPGGIYEFNRKGQILWSYHPESGSGMLDHPSLAERLPGGLIAVNDDYRDRVVIIDPHTRKIVWQYGHTEAPGTAPGFLNTPDGFDLLAPGGRTPTHPYTG
ncbi:MAG: kelch repeat-containing protein [Solirubrobacterales bacterium]